jgi:hypothetical protein
MTRLAFEAGRRSSPHREDAVRGPTSPGDDGRPPCQTPALGRWGWVESDVPGRRRGFARAREWASDWKEAKWEGRSWSRRRAS